MEADGERAVATVIAAVPSAGRLGGRHAEFPREVVDVVRGCGGDFSGGVGFSGSGGELIEAHAVFDGCPWGEVEDAVIIGVEILLDGTGEILHEEQGESVAAADVIIAHAGPADGVLGAGRAGVAQLGERVDVTSPRNVSGVIIVAEQEQSVGSGRQRAQVPRFLDRAQGGYSGVVIGPDDEQGQSLEAGGTASFRGVADFDIFEISIILTGGIDGDFVNDEIPHCRCGIEIRLARSGLAFEVAEELDVVGDGIGFGAEQVAAVPSGGIVLIAGRDRAAEAPRNIVRRESGRAAGPHIQISRGVRPTHRRVGEIAESNAVDLHGKRLDGLRADGFGCLQPIQHRVVVDVDVAQTGGGGIAHAGPARNEQHGQAAIGVDVVVTEAGERRRAAGIRHGRGGGLESSPGAAQRRFIIAVANQQQPVAAGGK